MNFNQYECWGGLAVSVFPENELLQYGFDSFLDDYTNSERDKILKLNGHERIVDTPATLNATYKLEYNCHSNGACSNCSGIRCCAIFLPNPKLAAFQTWLSTQPTIHCDPELSGVYPVGEFGKTWQCYDNDLNQWGHICGYEHATLSQLKKVYHTVRIFIIHTRAKQPVSEPIKENAMKGLTKGQTDFMNVLKSRNGERWEVYTSANMRIANKLFDMGLIDLESSETGNSTYARLIEPAAPEQNGVEQTLTNDNFFEFATFSDEPIVNQYYKSIKSMHHDIEITKGIEEFAKWHQSNGVEHGEEKSKWVKCIDTLPVRNENVIVFTRYKSRLTGKLNDFSNWIIGISVQRDFDYVTHWQPLPEPPTI